MATLTIKGCAVTTNPEECPFSQEIQQITQDTKYHSEEVRSLKEGVAQLTSSINRLTTWMIGNGEKIGEFERRRSLEERIETLESRLSRREVWYADISTWAYRTLLLVLLGWIIKGSL